MSLGTPHQALKYHMALEPEAYGPTTGNYGTAVSIEGYDELSVVLLTGLASTSAELDVTIMGGAVTTVSAMTTVLGTFTQVTAANDHAMYLGRVNLRNLSPAGSRYHVGVRALGDDTNKARGAVLFVMKGGIRVPESGQSLVFDA